jgi:hypothetical protein
VSQEEGERKRRRRNCTELNAGEKRREEARGLWWCNAIDIDGI